IGCTNLAGCCLVRLRVRGPAEWVWWTPQTCCWRDTMAAYAQVFASRAIPRCPRTPEKIVQEGTRGATRSRSICLRHGSEETSSFHPQRGGGCGVGRVVPTVRITTSSLRSPSWLGRIAVTTSNPREKFE